MWQLTKNPWTPENMPKVMAAHKTAALITVCQEQEKALQDSCVCCKLFMGWKVPEKTAEVYPLLSVDVLHGDWKGTTQNKGKPGGSS